MIGGSKRFCITMRNEWTEFIVVGAGIGIAVMVIRALIDPTAPQIQLLALALAGLALALLQFRLARRRRGRADQPPTERPAARPPRRTPFDHELTRNWTGLDERLTWPDAARPPDPDAQIAEPSGRSSDPRL